MKIPAIIKRLHDVLCLDYASFVGHINMKTEHLIIERFNGTLERFNIRGKITTKRENKMITWFVKFGLNYEIWELSINGIRRCNDIGELLPQNNNLPKITILPQ